MPPFVLFPFPLSDLISFFFLFFSLVHPKRGSRVRVRLNPISPIRVYLCVIRDLDGRVPFLSSRIEPIGDGILSRVRS